MKLLLEKVEDVHVIEEAAKDGGKKSLYIEGVFMQYDTKNKNGRNYPRNIMEKEVSRYVTEKVNPKRAFGELTHPNSPQIDLRNVSHLIESLKLESNGRVVGRAKILDTDMGRIARGLIEGGANLGVSSRGLGSLKQGRDGTMDVQEDFHLVTPADIVSDPSAPDAWVQGIMENADWIYDSRTANWKRAELIEDTRKEMKKMTIQEMETARMQLFSRFLKTL